MKKYLQAIGLLFLIIILTIINGLLNENILFIIGDISGLLSGIILSALIFIMSYIIVPKIKNCKKKDYFLFGVIWFVLYNLFVLIVCLIAGGSFMSLIKLYSFTINIKYPWTFVVLTILLSPIVVSKIKKLTD